MIWIILAAGLVVSMATMSLLGAWNTRRDLATGRPTYLSIADYTGIFDRKELETLCGFSDAEDRYTISPDTVERLPRRLWSRALDSPLLDIACLIAASVAACIAIAKVPGAWWVVGVALGYQVIGWLVATLVVLREASFVGDSE